MLLVVAVARRSKLDGVSMKGGRGDDGLFFSLLGCGYLLLVREWVGMEGMGCVGCVSVTDR